ncbi:MAG TPA: 23S rRNA pseudouridine(2604) synthase RluF [Flavobacterium sp.]|jgi:23S rRNA pseudouridine2604 synthase|nr:23S rRNA pseudouridine(2604) synthase RluF [Flavobacterium sp.]HPJ09059.1 23S rRNA pseudouridine(2604) synthase RluF [Flavobacterium sp.]
MEDNLKRLNKFIGETGYCSRREADALIAEGRVTINGIVPEMGTKVSPNDEVRIDGKLIRDNNEQLVYLAFNKPVGIECTTNLEVPENIVDYINYPKRIFPIGRLDKASEGLIFMTNDGDIVNKILRARNNHEKEYTVTVDKPITSRFIERMGNGVPILDTVTRKCKVEQISKYNFKIILTQGLNRQIRRMCEYLGYEVTALKRIRIINISLDLPVGRYRELTPAEIAELNKLIEPSSKTEEASLPKVENTSPERLERKPARNPEATIQKLAAAKRGPKTENNGFPNREDAETNNRRQQSASRNQEVQSFRKTPFRKETEQQKQSLPKPENKMIDMKCEAATDKTKQNEAKPASRWKVDFIKKDDPEYRKKGDY